MRIWMRWLMGVLMLTLGGLQDRAWAQGTELPPDDFNAALAKLGQGELAQIGEAVRMLGDSSDPRALAVLTALNEGRLRLDAQGKIYFVDDQGKAKEVVSGQLARAADLTEPTLSNAVRRGLLPAIGRLKLLSPDPRVRLAGARDLVERPRPEAIPLLRTALTQETVPQIRQLLVLALAQGELGDPDPAKRLAAARVLGDTASVQYKSLVEARLGKDEAGQPVEPDPKVRAALEDALDAINSWQFLTNTAGNLFYGLSLGSILLLSALGLAITFGLMGVINMAHGEMLMLGAYTTYVVQGWLHSHLPQVWDAYLLLAIPAAFIVTGLIGMLLEWLVIRHLYGRPLETLLATWGISLMLIQAVRMLFGAQNVTVANPAWLSGGLQVTEGLVLTYNRVAIIAFALLVLMLCYLLLQRTRLGLMVRAVQQNRAMAAAMGIATERVDRWTFALGSAIAGLGGVALSQLDNVGPQLGQAYIVDSFMVVVLGGVGQLAGTAAGAFMLGMINKFLEPSIGAVLGKVLVLVFIILFIQRRPQGLFALKGRAAEA